MMTGSRRSRLALVGLLLTGCTTATPESPVLESPVSGLPASGSTVDLAQVQVGDSVLGLEVTQVETSSLGSSGTVGTVRFDGEITLMGTYANESLAEAAPPVPCFYVAEESVNQLPQAQGDPRLPWFCFTNGEAAQAALGDRPSEPVTIVVDQYTINYIPSDVTNEAEFVRLAAP